MVAELKDHLTDRRRTKLTMQAHKFGIALGKAFAYLSNPDPDELMARITTAIVRVELKEDHIERLLTGIEEGWREFEGSSEYAGAVDSVIYECRGYYCPNVNPMRA